MGVAGDDGGRAASDLAAVRDSLPEACLGLQDGPGEPTLVVLASELLPVLRHLRDVRGYQLLRSVTAIDFHPASPRFQVVYHLTAIPAALIAGDPEPDPAEPARLVRVKAPLQGDAPVIDSAVRLYPGANYLEREVYDMFGIEFRGHPDPRRILMPDAFEGHPLRKDFPLQYEEVAFSRNESRVHSRKPRARR